MSPTRSSRHVFDAGDDVADLACLQPVGLDHVGREEAELVDLCPRAGLHRLDRLARDEGAVDDTHIGDDAAVLVEDGVEDQRARRRVGVSLGGGMLLDDRLERVLDALARLGRDAQDLVRRPRRAARRSRG